MEDQSYLIMFWALLILANIHIAKIESTVLALINFILYSVLAAATLVYNLDIGGFLG